MRTFPKANSKPCVLNLSRTKVGGATHRLARAGPFPWARRQLQLPELSPHHHRRRRHPGIVDALDSDPQRAEVPQTGASQRTASLDQARKMTSHACEVGGQQSEPAIQGPAGYTVGRQ